MKYPLENFVVGTGLIFFKVKLDLPVKPSPSSSRLALPVLHQNAYMQADLL